MADPVPGGTPPAGAPASIPGPEERRRESRESLIAFVVTGLAGIGLLLVLFATLQLYLAVQEAVRYWVADPYVPLVNGAFYIAVIAGGVYLVLRLLRKGG